MFHAFVIVCASTANFEIHTDICIRMNDTLGPYKTEENCNIRSNQIKDEALYGSLNESIFFVFGNPELIYVEPHCEVIKLDPAV